MFEIPHHAMSLAATSPTATTEWAKCSLVPQLGRVEFHTGGSAPYSRCRAERRAPSRLFRNWVPSHRPAHFEVADGFAEITLGTGLMTPKSPPDQRTRLDGPLRDRRHRKRRDQAKAAAPAVVGSRRRTPPADPEWGLLGESGIDIGRFSLVRNPDLRTPRSPPRQSPWQTDGDRGRRVHTALP